jgi:hypothetical protein
MEGEQRIQHSQHGYGGEDCSADLANTVAKVEKTDGKTTENDGKVEPGEKCTLIGEKHLWLNASGQSNALAWVSVSALRTGGGEGRGGGATWSSLEEWLRRHDAVLSLSVDGKESRELEPKQLTLEWLGNGGRRRLRMVKLHDLCRGGGEGKSESSVCINWVVPHVFK